jgi:hypothetical protein
MNTYTIQTDLFGKLKISLEDGLLEDFSVVLGGKRLAVTLNIFDGFLNDETIRETEAFLGHIPEMYCKARKAIEGQKESNVVISYFIQDQIEELEDICDFFGVESADEISPGLFVERLEPRTIFIAPNKDNTVDCTFDFRSRRIIRTSC